MTNLGYTLQVTRCEYESHTGPSLQCLKQWVWPADLTGAGAGVPSTNNGLSWSPPRSLNPFLGPIGRGVAPGPGNAIQLRTPGKSAGRLLFPGWSCVCNDTKTCANSLMGQLTYAVSYYSDDGAKTWQMGPGGVVPRSLLGPVAEPTLAELSVRCSISVNDPCTYIHGQFILYGCHLIIVLLNCQTVIYSVNGTSDDV